MAKKDPKEPWPVATKVPKAPRRPRARAQGTVWSFRSDKTPVQLRVNGHAAIKHCNAPSYYKGMPAFIALKIEIGSSVDWILDLDPDDAKRFHEELGKAIAGAEPIQSCGENCSVCKEQELEPTP